MKRIAGGRCRIVVWACAPLLLSACGGPVPTHPETVRLVRYSPSGATAATITDPRTAAALALAFDRLPPAPGGSHPCDVAVIAGTPWYLSITFTYHRHPALQLITLACPVVAVLGPDGNISRARSLTPDLQARLDALLPPGADQRPG